MLKQYKREAWIPACAGTTAYPPQTFTGAAPASAVFGGSIIGIRLGARVASNCTGSALVKS